MADRSGALVVIAPRLCRQAQSEVKKRLCRQAQSKVETRFPEPEAGDQGVLHALLDALLGIVGPILDLLTGARSKLWLACATIVLPKMISMTTGKP